MSYSSLRMLLAAAVVFAVGATTASAQKLVSFAAGPQVGTFYVVLSSYAKAISDNLGVRTNVEVTGGPTQNVQLIHANKADFGLSTMAPIYEGYHGIGWAKGTKYDNIRTVLPTFVSFFEFYTFDERGIDEVTKVAGKRLSAGSTASTPNLFAGRIFELLGGAPNAIIAGSYADLNNQLRDGLVDVGFTVSGIPHPAISQLAAARKIRIFSFSEVERDKIQEKYPYLTDCAIPANTYEGQDYEVPTVCLWNAIITPKEQSAELVYDFTKTIFENKKTLLEAHKTAQYLDPKNVNVLATPMHRGAARYYTEVGVQIPDGAKPID